MKLLHRHLSAHIYLAAAIQYNIYVYHCLLEALLMHFKCIMEEQFPY